ncbi:AAA family ATPase [Streptomyces sp. NPDC093109]|uniref:AAA family ATPase n=1 Tax=Streptomyces sp. NPDC093109 TaxID=3154977 RepID=UPI00344D7B67
MTDPTPTPTTDAMPMPHPGTLVVLVGVSGSGKSTLAGRYPSSWIVCLDSYRLAATDDMTDQSSTPVAAQIQRLLLDARLARDLTSIVDSTNVQRHVRAGLLARARYWQRDSTAVLLDIPFDICERQNATRTRRVPYDILRAQHELLPTEQELIGEGFTDVVRITSTDAAPGFGR